MTPDLLSACVRALAFAALFQAAGVGPFLAIFGRQVTHAHRRIGRLGLLAASGGLVLALLHLSLDAPRMAGDFQGLWDWDLQQIAWTSMSGVAQLAQAVGLATIALALRSSAPLPVPWACLGSVIALGGFLLTGHTSAHPLRVVLAPLLALHVLIAAFWFGSLLPLMLVMRDETQDKAVRVIERFSAIAIWLVPVILLAGLGMGWLLAGSIRVLQRPYGEILIAKVAGFALLMVLAANNKWRLTPALSAGGTVLPLRRAIAIEYVLIIAILAATAVLTTFFSPE
jgi:putative copper export protein